MLKTKGNWKIEEIGPVIFLIDFRLQSPVIKFARTHLAKVVANIVIIKRVTCSLCILKVTVLDEVPFIVSFSK